MKTQDIARLPAGSKLYDDKVSGLFVQANANGTKTFRVVYRNKFKHQHKVKIGYFGAFSLEKARAVAQDLLARVARGEDPAQDWKTMAAGMTVNELMLKMLKGYWNQPRYHESRLFKDALQAFKNNFGPIGACKLSELNVKLVDRWHKNMAHKPILANRCVSYLSTAINWAIKNDLTDIRNPCPLVKKFPKVRRSRYASIEEVQKIGRYLEENFAENPRAALYLYLILTTGTRPSAIGRLMWKNLKINHNDKGEEVGIITFFGKSSAVTGEEEMLIIPPTALQMIKQMPRDSEYILPEMKMPTKFWRTLRKKFNCSDLWARDLRRTYATIGLSNGVSLTQVGELLNHKCWDTTKIYAKLMTDQRINSAMQIANKIEDIIQH